MKFEVDPKVAIQAFPSMATFNPTDPTSLVVTGSGLYKYYKLIDNQSLKCQVQQLTKKEQGFSTQYTCHTWTDDWLILYTERGEILLVETDGNFKMLLPDSPVHSFSIRYAMNSRPNGFILADN